MKTSKTFTLDFDVWSKARTKYTNLSEAIERLLRADLERAENDPDQDPEALAKEIQRLQSVLASVKAELNIQETKSNKQNSFEYVED